MIRDLIMLNNSPYEIWYESSAYKIHAINEAKKQSRMNTLIKTLQTNLIQNPGFESGTGNIPSNWTSVQTGTTATFSYPATGQSGNAVSIMYPAVESGAEAYWYQDVAVTAGTSYMLSAVASLSNVVGSGVSIQIDWFGSTGSWLATSVAAGGLVGTLGWTTYSGTVTSPTGAAMARVTLLFPTSSGTVSFDNISLTSGGTPPPTTPPPGGTTPPPGGTTPPPGGTTPPPVTVTCPSGQTNVIGTCLPTNYLIYGGIGIALLMVLKR